MSNYGLRSRLSELQSRLAREEAYNSQLRGELSAINSAASGATGELSRYGQYVDGELDRAQGSVLESEKKGGSAIEVEENIEFLFRRFKNIEAANKKIRECNNRTYYEFKNYRNIRKIVQGMLDNLNFGLVEMSVLARAVEVNHLQLPDYWLTCALLGIMAWIDDNVVLAKRCLERAMSLEAKATIVFFMLFNLRMRRHHAALLWLKRYEECDFNGADRDTFLLLVALMCQCVSTEVDEDIRKEADGFVVRKLEQAATQTDSSEALGRIIRHFDKMGAPAPMDSYPSLQRHVQDVGEMARVLGKAKNNTNIVEFLRRIAEFDRENRNRILENYIEELVAAPNQAEAEVFKTIEYNERIIRLKGDVEAAKDEQHSVDVHHASRLNLLFEMIDWIYAPCLRDMTGEMKNCLFVMCGPFQERAYAAYRQAYLARVTPLHPVVIEDYRTNADLGAREAEDAKIVQHFEEIRDGELAKVGGTSTCVAGILCALAAVGALVCKGVGGEAAIWTMPLALVAVVCLFVALGTAISHRMTRSGLRRKCEGDIARTQACMGQIFDEYASYCAELQQFDAYHSVIGEYMRSGRAGE